MSKHEAQARFHDWCAARHRKAETRRLDRCVISFPLSAVILLLRSRCVMHTQRSPLTTVLIRSGSGAEGGSILRHRPLTCRIVKEI